MPADLASGPIQPHYGAGQVHELLFCRIAVDHAVVLDSSSVHERAVPIPDGYDAVKLHNSDDDGDSDPNYYYHEYLLNDDSRAAPLYLVSFTFDPDADHRKRNPVCEQCEHAPATLYCLQDNARFCEHCDADLHSKSKVLEKHSRVLISEVQGNLTLTRCKQHPDMPIQFYDKVTHEPVCVHCKMVGSHSCGDNAHHPLVTINEAYAENLAVLQQDRELVEQKQRHIAAQLQNVDERLRTVHLNASTVERQLRDILKRALDKLQAETQARLNLLLSDESELRRQMHYFEWLESFIRYQKDVVDPVEFLSSCRHHLSLLREAPNEVLTTSPEVLNDCEVQGSLDVVSTPTPSSVLALSARGLGSGSDTARMTTPSSTRARLYSGASQASPMVLRPSHS